MQLLRVLTVMDNQVRDCARGSSSPTRTEAYGTYWATYSDIDDFEMTDALPAPTESRTSWPP